jgi:HAD domain in Swiss Army Knife RNA repair proteins
LGFAVDDVLKCDNRAHTGRVAAPLRVLFLDIDGVLNSHRSCLALGGIPHSLTPDDLRLFDPLALALLQSLCEVAELSVVVSSSWRILHNWDAIGRALDLPTIGATPRLGGVRGEEIAEWLLTSPTPVESYAILDDDSDMLSHQMPRFVKTEYSEGLTFRNLRALCRMFGVSEFDCFPQRRAELAALRRG